MLDQTITVPVWPSNGKADNMSNCCQSSFIVSWWQVDQGIVLGLIVPWPTAVRRGRQERQAWIINWHVVHRVFVCQITISAFLFIISSEPKTSKYFQIFYRNFTNDPCQAHVTESSDYSCIGEMTMASFRIAVVASGVIQLILVDDRMAHYCWVEEILRTTCQSIKNACIMHGQYQATIFCNYYIVVNALRDFDLRHITTNGCA